MPNDKSYFPFPALFAALRAGYRSEQTADQARDVTLMLESA